MAATRRQRGPLRGKEHIGLRVGKAIDRYKVGGLLVLEITETSFDYRRNEVRIAEQAALDGFYVIRTSVPKEQLGAEEAVRSYKRALRRGAGLSQLQERRPQGPTDSPSAARARPGPRVSLHAGLLCGVAPAPDNWHLSLFDDTEPESRTSDNVPPSWLPPQRSASAQRKAQSKKTPDGLPAHSFQTLMKNLATLTRNRIQPTLPGTPSFQTLTRPSPLQQKALSLLGITPRV